MTFQVRVAEDPQHQIQKLMYVYNFEDIREHDVPYHVRVSIDKSIYVGSWYQVKSRYHPSTFSLLSDTMVLIQIVLSLNFE